MNEIADVRGAVAAPETMTAVDPQAQLHAALARAQAEYGDIKKNATVDITTRAGGKYGFKYANLDAILAATVPALAKHGLAITHTMKPHPRDEAKVILTARLLHAAGGSLESEVAIAGPAGDMKEFGSRVTYMRRYTAAPLLGVVADQDNDGAIAAGDTVHRHEEEPPRNPAPPQDVRRGGMQEYARNLPARQPQSNGGEVETLPVRWPNGHPENLRGKDGEHVEGIWVAAMRSTIANAPDTAALNEWWAENGRNLGVVQERYPNAAKAARDAYTLRLGELEKKPQAAL
jgi:hypothetical protein